MKIPDIRKKLAAAPHVSLGHFPTPLEFMENLSRDLAQNQDGPQIWIKRDDCSGLASGGNKTRKLEFVLGDALAQGADTILTTGGIQSNHARQTAAACARLGLRCILFLIAPPNGATDIYKTSGNILLDKIFGADIRIIPQGTDSNIEMATCAKEITNGGGKPYVVPLGASTPAGALGYVACALEIITENPRTSHVISAAGSGATQAGLVAGFAALGADVLCEGIDIDAERDRTEQRTRDLLPDIMSLIGASNKILPPVIVRDGFAGEGYGIISQMAQEAIQQVALSEGIILDSAYTGKAMAALISEVKEGRYGKDDVIVFLHTGGFPLTFAYA